MNSTPYIMMISEQLATAVYILTGALVFVVGNHLLHVNNIRMTDKLTPGKAVVYISAIALALVLGYYVPYLNNTGIPGLLIVLYAALLTSHWVFRKLKTPGIGGAETHDKEQGTALEPLSPAQTQRAVTGTTPSVDTMKVLATLWHYQRQTFGNDTTKRWTFIVHPVSSDYPGFLAGLSEAVNRGWAAVSPKTHQCLLTNEGLAYIEGNADVQKYGDIYKF